MSLELRPFRSECAATIASWIHSDRDLLWLAPRTPPPVTPEKVLAWSGPRNNQFLLHERGDDPTQPRGYGEINLLHHKPDELWLGHIIVGPDQRRRGLGVELVRLLLHEAFTAHTARIVSLVVFRDNEPAARCYLKSGFVSVGEELHRFTTRGPRHPMLRMDITRSRWNAIHSSPPRATPPRPQ